ncbi:glycosyl transferase family 2 [Candidatus Roizmanbacteria bacterium CG10_big_fil_rev_8_21_14_0_10_45_7]|uniref:Glycosyl transferase family 2 n=1 Tax=Candidatus Roizmanbacteria bacterium CG10_big_fil_rev_8_21_14_0_10_45_7 TaxID=1974854 RepID=A0A2M8KUU5_9BACT|nr:MAG: glycosyl transferase family 2 [Candidatus Roizmanbacteria bacterium CG10_big_fil_rev_8_21_14_0_10_45_7]
MKLSVIIPSYNTAQLLSKTIELLRTRLQEHMDRDEYEIMVVDNHSTDETTTWLKKQKDIISILNAENVGFSRANNQGIERARGTYVLLLNSDVLLDQAIDFNRLIAFLEEDKKRGALTIKLYTNTTQIDPACHRGFPTPINALWYFTGLEQLTRSVPFLARVFGGYHLTWLPFSTTHEIDCPTAAFFLAKKKAIDEVGGFDPDYFFYAEDIDLCYRLKENGWTIWFYPHAAALHLKYQSGQKNHDDTAARRKSRYWFFKSMGMFYDKHYQSRYPSWLNGLVHMTVTGMTRQYAP